MFLKNMYFFKCKIFLFVQNITECPFKWFFPSAKEEEEKKTPEFTDQNTGF